MACMHTDIKFCVMLIRKKSVKIYIILYAYSDVESTTTISSLSSLLSFCLCMRTAFLPASRLLLRPPGVSFAVGT